MRPTWEALTVVTSCSGYGPYLAEWADSLITQTVRPGHVVIFTHGTPADDMFGHTAFRRLMQAGLSVAHWHHYDGQLDFGAARNSAVHYASSEWVLHLDADDTLQPHAVATFEKLAEGADVISAGYTRTGRITRGVSTKSRVYDNLDGAVALDAPALCSSNSPFRRTMWEMSPYRTDMFGAWDTAFWIGLAHLGARFRATPVPVFNYRQHPDSVFAKRSRTVSWPRVHTTAKLRSLRRRYEGVAVVVPRDFHITTDRQRNWEFVKAHYAQHHPDWQVVEGHCTADKWSKGVAIQNAMNHTNAALLVLADADCIVDPYWLTATVELVRQGAAWGMPHTMVNRLTEQSTLEFLQGADRFDGVTLTRERYEGVSGGGIVVVRRIDYDAIGGIPQSFVGWGSEDRALALLCDTLLGTCARGKGELLHLHHFPQPKTRLTQDNVKLLQRLGQAAQRGRDALVQTVHTLNRAPTRPWHVQPVDVQAQQERQSFLVRRQGRVR